MRALEKFSAISNVEIIRLIEIISQFAEVNTRPVKKVPSLRDTLIFILGKDIDPVISISATRLSADFVPEGITEFKSAKEAQEYIKKLRSIRPQIIVTSFRSLQPYYLLLENLNEDFILISCDQNYLHAPVHALSKLFLVHDTKARLNKLTYGVIGDIQISGVAKSMIGMLSKLEENTTIVLFGEQESIPAQFVNNKNIIVTADKKTLSLVDVLVIIGEQEATELNAYQTAYWEKFRMSNKDSGLLKEDCLIIEVGPISDGLEVENTKADYLSKRSSKYHLNPEVAAYMAVFYSVSDHNNTAGNRDLNLFENTKDSSYYSKRLSITGNDIHTFSSMNFSFTIIESYEKKLVIQDSVLWFTEILNPDQGLIEMTNCRIFNITINNVKLEETILNGSYFEKCTFNEVVFFNCSFRETFFIDCEFKKCSFIQSNFTNASVYSSQVLQCSFINSNFVYLRFKGNNLAGTMFERNKYFSENEVSGLPDNFAISCINLPGLFTEKTKVEVLKTPLNLRTALKQYITYFNEFVEIAKGKEIYFESKFVDSGIEIEMKYDSEEEEEEISSYFMEYLGFIKQNIDNLTIEFKANVDPVKMNLLYLELRQEITMLNAKLEIKNFETRTLHSIVSNYEKKLASESTQPNITLNVSQSLTHINNISKELPMLAEELSKLLKSTQGLGVDCEQQIATISSELAEKVDEPTNEKNISSFKKVRKLLLDVTDKKTEIGKTVSASKTSMKIVKNLIGIYNKIAFFTGLPPVPENLLK